MIIALVNVKNKRAFYLAIDEYSEGGVSYSTVDTDFNLLDGGVIDDVEYDETDEEAVASTVLGYLDDAGNDGCSIKILSEESNEDVYDRILDVI